MACVLCGGLTALGGAICLARFDPKTTQGPQVAKAQIDKILADSLGIS
jgi:hypothetical protein